MLAELNTEAHAAALSWIAAADAERVEMVRARFDGSRLGTVELSDGSEHDVIVDVDQGYVTIDAFADDPEFERWVREHQRDLVNAWDERGEP